ncbi:amino acid ABC transporter substrate-binding protein [Treponema sp. OMZ 792]|uniref:ABC transporter substrate-binding protein n=1 Tax=unclassified Treponema TaxID=2638727 RepID=UPI0020A2F9FC|nr:MULTISPECIES: transporter substrate-binding domain-containing protein [unclassified Treponema]UTC75739.1 amino acid ABC transporter substrate-binding protein [Treponema sp. OMZ 792]UTC79738.1 amino acid ABC transporter substrate-binding protein [Treponema sp. OMZ 798]
MRNKLNSKAFFFAVILLFGLMFSCKKNETYEMSSDDVSLAEVLVRSKIIVGVNVYNPPICFYNNNNEIIGFDVDVFKEIANIMNIEAEFRPIVPSEVNELINSGAIDCIASGFSYSNERNETYELTQAYLRNAIVLLTLRSREIKTIEDLKGKKIGGQKGSLGAALIKNNPDMMSQIHSINDSYNNIPQILGDLKTLGLDACVGDISTIAGYLSKEPDVYSLVGQAVALDSYVYACKKGSKALKMEIERVLYVLEKKGILEKISRKWFDADLVIFGK